MPDIESSHNFDGFFGRDFEKVFGVGVLVLVTLASALAMSPSVADPDLWGHVQFGRDTLQNGVAETTSYSFTAGNFRWINHENLSEVTMAFLVDRFGPAGLLWFKFALSLLVIGAIIWFNFTRGVSLVPTSILALLVAWNLGYHWSFRPQLSSFVLFALMVVLFQFCFANWRDRWNLKWPGLKNFSSTDSKVEQSWFQGRMLWLLVPIVFVWTNSHGGFVAGVCISIAYLMLRAFEAVCSRGRDGFGLVWRMLLISAAVAATTLLNPYSFRLPMWLLESLGDPRPEIVDWSNGQLWTLVGFKFWCLLLLMVFSLIFTKKSRDFVHCVLLAITLWQALSHFRHVPFFTILCGFWMGPHLESALNRWSTEKTERPLLVGKPKLRLAAYGFVLLLIGLVSIRVSDRLSTIKVDRSVFPVDAFSFLKQNEINGRIVVTYNWAQYTIGALCTESGNDNPSRVAFDGRFRTCYPQEIVDMHFDFLYGEQDVIQRHRSPFSPPLDPGRVLEYGGPDLVINKKFDEVTTKHMLAHQNNWSLLYEDGLAQIWGAKSKFDDPSSKHYLPPNLRISHNEIPRGFVAWPAINPSSKIKSSKKLSKELVSSNSLSKS